MTKVFNDFKEKQERKFLIYFLIFCGNSSVYFRSTFLFKEEIFNFEKSNLESIDLVEKEILKIFFFTKNFD